MDNNDLRYLLGVEPLPLYDQELLMDGFDDLMEWYSKELDNGEYTRSLMLTRNDLKTQNKINALKVAYYFIELGQFYEAKLTLNEFGYNIKPVTKSLPKILKKIGSEATKLEIRRQRRLLSKGEDKTYEEMVSEVELILNATGRIDKYNLSLKEIVEYIKQAKKINKNNGAA